MLVTVAPCAIKGATFDCLRDAIERREIYREEEAKDGSRNGASPARVRRPSALDQGIDLLRADAPLYLAICQAPRSITGSDPAVTTHSTVHLCFNRSSFYLAYIALRVFVHASTHPRGYPRQRTSLLKTCHRFTRSRNRVDPTRSCLCRNPTPSSSLCSCA